MVTFFRGLNEQMSSLADQGIQRCPFLRNINEPTNFTFSSPLSFAMPVRGAKGPIFEDAPNFDIAFRLFHGHDGVVPLSGKSFVHSDNLEEKPAVPQFNPWAAKAASISLSPFGTGGFFGFGSFNENWKKKNQKKSISAKKESSSQGAKSSDDAVGNSFNENWKKNKKKSKSAKKESSSQGAKSSHEAVGNSFNGNWKKNQKKSKSAKKESYRAVSGALPLLAKALQSQSMPSKMMVIGALGLAGNVPLGIWREHTEKFSPSWFVAVHAAVPFMAMLSNSVLMPKNAMAVTIAASILGQLIGSRTECIRLKMVAAKKAQSTTAAVAGSKQLQVMFELKWTSQRARGDSGGEVCY